LEINHYFDDIVGVIPTADIVEGRVVVFTSHTHDYDFGSKVDLPGAKVPATAEEANNARHIITWQKDNRPYPAALPIPEYTFNLRQGYGKDSNAPFAAYVYLTDRGNQEGLTIPSGTPSLAFGKGIYTVPSGAYIDHNSIVNPGALLQVANTAEDSSDAGKLKYLSAYSTRKVGTVREYNSTTGALTFELD
jgi:hypothetical protein